MFLKATDKKDHPLSYLIHFGNESGFTLIELLVTVAIITIIFGFGIAKYNQFNRRQILVQAAQELKSNLRLTQSKALAGDCSDDKCGGDDGICGTGDVNEKSLDGWYISFSADRYQIYGLCEGVQFPDPVRTVNLGNRNITILSPPSPICFKPLGQGVEGGTTITLSGYGEPQTVTVTATGEIR